MTKSKEKQKCEWIPCDEDAKWTEITPDGRMVKLCTVHRRALRKQKKILINSGY